MTLAPPPVIADHFDHLQDPRRAQGRLHRLDHILTIALCAIVAGAEGWADIATFGRAKAVWLTRRLGLTHGPPSADTIRRVLSTIDSDAFAEGFVRWVESVATKTTGEVVAIDGKALRRSYHKDDPAERVPPQAMIHMVSAWASEQRLVLAQTVVNEKSNEITAIPRLLDVLDLSGCIVTIDAMGTQTEIAAQLRDQGADYVLALKGNQGTLDDDVRDYFETLHPAPRSTETVGYAESIDVGHGRKEVRRLWVSSDLDWMAQKDDWAGLQSLVMVESERHTDTGVAHQRRYYITNLPATDASSLLGAVRSHWGIENGVHWVLDVVFREDESRVRRGHGGANLAGLRHLALNLLRRSDSTDSKLSLRMRRKRAGWDERFLEEVVGV